MTVLSAPFGPPPGESGARRRRTSGRALALASPSLAEETARRQNGGQMRRGIRNPGEAVMSQVTIAPPDIKTLADLWQRLGGIPLERIWFHPAPGTATEKDVIEAEVRGNRFSRA